VQAVCAGPKVYLLILLFGNFAPLSYKANIFWSERRVLENKNSLLKGASG
jgi:hypothetical protein